MPIAAAHELSRNIAALAGMPPPSDGAATVEVAADAAMREANALHHVIHVVHELSHTHRVTTSLWAQEGWHGGDLHDTAGIAQCIQLLVIQVARVVTQRGDTRMRRHHRHPA